ncbi:hypothetical protein CSKR_102406 [Clonorchis sinensis]|uniref:Uncharacterized protein n=1 Tax=Clonorchis sinensis TaxID=79923 RepID=A0A419QEW7_CLOSI|nr:hypothetical protein CSKR_102406 [Clonorchis sinensis]
MIPLCTLVRDSNPTPSSYCILFRLRQPASVLALVLPSGMKVARHRKGSTAQQVSFFETIIRFTHGSPTVRFRLNRYKPKGTDDILNVWIEIQILKAYRSNKFLNYNSKTRKPRPYTC